MAKKRKKAKISKVIIVQKRVEHKKVRTKTAPAKKPASKEIENLLIDNFVGLQKAMTNLSSKFEALAEQNSKLLQIFELAAKNYLEGETEAQKKDIISKIDALMEQNKTIASGLILLQEQMSNQAVPTEIERREERTVVQTPGNQGIRPKTIPRI